MYHHGDVVVLWFSQGTPLPRSLVACRLRARVLRVIQDSDTGERIHYCELLDERWEHPATGETGPAYVWAAEAHILHKVS